MKDINSLLAEKLQQKNQTKLQTIADRSLTAQPLGFKAIPLSENENTLLRKLLLENQTQNSQIDADFNTLKLLTQELKAIQAQAIILHGERIKKAQTLLKAYKEGAFTEWLLTVYGNRQTPYNFLQYYEFYLSLTDLLKSKLLDMPKQAIYTLASRSGPFEKKELIIKSYQGEPKHLLLAKIRSTFPLSLSDKRKQKFSESILLNLSRFIGQMDRNEWCPTSIEKKKIKDLLKAFHKKLESL